uniref:NADH-ubiquinone oxidoreductase chain 3 n=1 Tax=Ornithodoros parkeri TaxID=140564 RepID=A0A3G2K011_ORNPR|nr:NADH dehydrogenase subunit 3 [Ornithodoros parkeri]AYN50630.1 NADH dehydrogenase subunit 3 [Ornithodoros parkeri]
MKFLLISILMSSIITSLGMAVKKKNSFKKEKNSPFECGFDPFSLSRSPFSLRFFMIAIIFLIFDIEIIILLPFPLVTNFDNPNSLTIMSLIMIIILMGLLYEWKNGMIEWIS